MTLATEFKELFTKTTNIDADTVATVDHIFSSPPPRLIDSHYQLMAQYPKAVILLWDITKPNMERYRSDLILDSSLYSTKDTKFYVYPPNEYYSLSEHLYPDFDSQEMNVISILERLNYPSIQISRYQERFNHLKALYAETLNKTISSLEFYLDLLPKFYKLLGLGNLQTYISERTVSLYYSGILNVYIPALIEATESEPFGLSQLLVNSPLFKPPYFRSTSNEDISIELENRAWILSNFSLIKSKLKDGTIIPSLQIILWALSLAQLKHFGNDYGFLSDLDKYLIEEGDNLSISKLQITRHKEDGSNFAEFANSLSYSSYTKKGKIKVRCITPKASRVTNLCSIYLHLGEATNQYIREFLKGDNSYKLEMGNIL